MFPKVFASRSRRAAAGFVAVAAMMVLSVSTVEAVGPQQEQQQEKEALARIEAELAAQQAKARRAALEYRLGLGRQLAAERDQTRARAKAILGEAQAAARQRAGTFSSYLRPMLQERIRERAMVTPRVEIRGLRGFYGHSLVDRALALADDLELSEQQEDDIRAARRGHRRDQIERDAEIEITDMDLDELLEDRHNADLGEVERLMQQRASLRVQDEVADLRLSQQVWGMLTQEQRDQLEEESGSVLLYRGGRPSSMLWRRSDGERGLFGELGFGKFFDFDQGDLDVFSDDGDLIWEYKVHPDEDLHFDDEQEERDQEKTGTEGAAIGAAADPRTGAIGLN